MRNPTSFAVSACLHGGILGWLIFGPGVTQSPEPHSIYDREIRPNEKKIVWYNLREKLPEVAPASSHSDAHPDPRRPRARVKFEQTVVSGARDDARPPQMIWTPEPAIEQPTPPPLPNVVAVAPTPAPAPTPKLLRPFVVPPARSPPAAPQPLAQARTLPEAPPMAANAQPSVLPLPTAALSQHASPQLGPQPLPFTAPPAVRLRRQAALLLPEAPAVQSAVELKGLPIAAALPRPQPLAFTAPAGAGSQLVPAVLPAAPDVPAPPAVESASLPAQASLAMVGLNPARTMVVPAPPAPREAGFSAGQVVRPEGGMGDGRSGARISVPGLLLRDGAKDGRPSLVANFSPTSRENLLAASRSALNSAAASIATARVSGSPDPRMAGRMVYTVAIQMPNVTSYSGSWIVWFAVREAGAGAESNSAGPAPVIRPPVPLRKVDPKYVQSAVSDRVEGKVLLSALIRKDGHVEAVVLLRGVDERLDRSAGEALAKWEFEPAMRNGLPVDVDAVFEIPFRLAPKPIH